MNYLQFHSLRLVATTIKTASKRAQGIAWLIIISVLVGTLGAFWLSLSVLVPLWASIGGMIVLLGLLLEKEWNEKNEKFKPPFLSPYKSLAECGWKILMFGIAVEIVTAFALAAREAIIDVKHDPFNQPIRFVTASVDIFVGGTNGLNVNFKDPLRGRVLLIFGSSQHLTSGWAECSLRHCSAQYALLRDDSGALSTCWHFEFDQNGMFGQGIEMQDKEVAGKANGWDTVALDMFFLPTDTKVQYGNITLTVNNPTIKKNTSFYHRKRSAPALAR